MVEVLKLKRHSPPIGWYLRTLNLSRELIKDSKFIVSNQNLLDILQKEYKNVTYFNWK